MKIQRLSESKSLVDIRKTIDEYYNFLRDIKPAVIEEYLELAEDEEYYPDEGDKPSKNVYENDLGLVSVFDSKKGFQFELAYWHRGETLSTYYIYLTDEQVETGLMKKDATRYNL